MQTFQLASWLRTWLTVAKLELQGIEEKNVSRKIQCVKLQRELEAIPYKPFDNELGERIYESISMEAWQMWLEFSKMLVNEYQLRLTETKSHEFLFEQCEKYFFGEGAALPPEFVPEQS